MTVKELMMFFSMLLSLIRVSWFSSSDHNVKIVHTGSSYSRSAEKDFACEDADREFSVSPGQKLTINAETGASIRITGWNQNTVTVQTQADDDSDCRVEFNQSSTGVEVRTKTMEDDSHSDVHFDIHVPSRFNVSVETMGGDVQIEGVEGEIEGRTMGGKLRFAKLKGKVDFTTMGGAVNLTDSNLDGHIETMGGNVEFRNVSGGVKGSSMGGVVTYKDAKDNKGNITGEVHMTSMGGDLNVSTAPEGAYLHTMGGDIHVSSARDYVKAETMGGTIELDAVDGWIHASTMGGNVIAKMIGDPARGKRDVDLTSLGGDIELTVPAGLSMNFDVQLAFTNRNEGRYHIKSDFPIQQEESQKWDYRNGTPRKYIYGTGKVGSGANRIRIRTINGDIIIKKG